MGDNRNNSFDSHKWGALPASPLRGRCRRLRPAVGFVCQQIWVPPFAPPAPGNVTRRRGFLQVENVIGRACFKYWPPQKIGPLEDVTAEERAFLDGGAATAPPLR